MHFELLLDAVFGPREVLHDLECTVCGHNELYYIHPQTGKQIGRACEECNFFQKFDDNDMDL
ncbi:hypothetical protein [Bacillus timonensis]|uniref:hypothetical protein n=1 Tax=Bacillus timonensis TaxID=1033734 RepID=UPI00028A21F8|nr:hypothetical protein [Bacillus timonensis]